MMSDWSAETRQAFYSTNQGYSWRSLEFSTAPMNVSNILTEMNAMSTNFVIFGTRETSQPDVLRGVLFHVDLETVGLPVCKGLYAADQGSLQQESDYELWTPSDGKSEERCLLGRQAQYKRRKQLAECLNDKDLTWPITTKNCTCSQEDFECESGFVRSIEHMTCRTEHQSDFYEDEEGNPGVCKSVDYYDIDAYRKIGGDSCKGGWLPEKVRLPCKVLKAEAFASLARNATSRWPSWLLFFAKGVAGVALLSILICCWRSKTIRVWLLSMRIRMSGQRDYSSTVADPPSAVNDPTNIGAPSKPVEMGVVP